MINGLFVALFFWQESLKAKAILLHSKLLNPFQITITKNVIQNVNIKHCMYIKGGDAVYENTHTVQDLKLCAYKYAIHCMSYLLTDE